MPLSNTMPGLFGVVPPICMRPSARSLAGSPPAGCANAMTWCTTERALGLISIACSHLSSTNSVGIRKYWYGIVPAAGTV